MSDRKRILCFGDSLTWGWMPVDGVVPTTRYPFTQRWTGVAAASLGEGYEIIEEGLSGRTTNLDDPADARLNGSAYLPAALASHFPLDLVVLMLGTNDTKAVFRRSAYDIAYGLSQLLVQVGTSAGGVGTAYPAPRALVVAPPPLGAMTEPWLQVTFDGTSQAKSRDLAGHYEALAGFFKVDFLDAGKVLTTDGSDGVHFTAENNRALGLAIAAKAKAILAR